MLKSVKSNKDKEEQLKNILFIVVEYRVIKLLKFRFCKDQQL